MRTSLLHCVLNEDWLPKGEEFLEVWVHDVPPAPQLVCPSKRGRFPIPREPLASQLRALNDTFRAELQAEFLARIFRLSLSSDLSDTVSTPVVDHWTFNCSGAGSIPGTVAKEPDRTLHRVDKNFSPFLHSSS
uniref:Uncharacterized protein n=1 Tax=Eutreptiella gymnastica TaxID=73025 RepID=A0A7S4FPK0_9EUGL|mmetsp:Transcript_17932/g.28487  ORF Transcript_17932/g.28487 Transcript_17932/m.28487 type:complete len:133 (-) Transcript_17932:53-451(-)